MIVDTVVLEDTSILKSYKIWSKQRENMSKLGGKKKNNLNSGGAFKEQNNRFLRRVFHLKKNGTLLEANASRTQPGCYIYFSPNLQSRRKNVAKKWKDRENQWKNMANKCKDNHSSAKVSLSSKQVLVTFPNPRCSLLFLSPLQPPLCVILKGQRAKTKQK